MKEFDFDELDKAVTSLMGPESTDQTAASASASVSVSKPVTDQPATVAESSAVSDTPDVVASSAAPQVIKKAAGAMPARRAGRFMDVVHPSSDMKSAAKPVMSPTREANSVEPVASVATPSIGELMDEHLSEEKEPTPVAAEMTMPDPLDQPSATDTPEVVETPALNETTPVAEEAPLSPFIPDAKVEKRPLGSPTTPDLGSFEDKPGDAEPVTDTAVPVEPLQAELNNDVLAIEADNSHDTLRSEPAAPAEPKAPKPEAHVQPDHLLAASTAGASIAQQYKQQASTGDQHHEALYDSAARDSQALAHPAKKKSGWLVLLWIILLIVVGAGGAVALYFLKVI